jgi:O-antigen/teichoic acid export membrane protein
MSLVKSFVKFSFGSWVAAAISFFTTPIITLLLVPQEFGRAATFAFTNALLLQVVLAGGDQGFMRFFYEKDVKDRPALLWNSLLPSFLFWIILSSSILFLWKPVSQWLIADEQFLIAVLLTINLFLVLLDRYTFLVIRMQQKGTIFSLLRILTSILNAIFIIVYCRYVSKSFYAIIAASMFSLTITIIISVFVEHRFWFSKIAITKKEIIQLLKYGIPFAPACLMSILFESLDKVFLRTYRGFEEMGLYSAAYKIVALLAIVQTGFSMFWTPVSFENYEKYPDDTSLYEKTYRYLLVILTILGLLLIGCKDLIILIFAKGYREAANLVPFLVFIPVLYTLTEITCLGIYFKKKSMWQLIVFGILLVVSLSFNYILVPLLGAKGAALVVAISYTAYFFLRTYVSIRLYPMNFHLGKTMLTFIMLYIVAGLNTFVASKIVGISCAAAAVLVYSLFHISTIKDMLIYFRNLLNMKIVKSFG